MVHCTERLQVIISRKYCISESSDCKCLTFNLDMEFEFEQAHDILVLVAYASIEGPERHMNLYSIARAFVFHAKRRIIIYIAG